MRRVAIPVALLATLAVYLAGQQHNPPGFFADESSIAYNALTIARHGTDEYGAPHPLYFTAFGEYKNPTYIYLLAAVFRVLRPSNLVARRLSAILVFTAALATGALGWRISRKRWIAAVTFLTAIATPMLFEISRLVFEVALFPLAAIAFVWSVFEASRRERWTPADIARIAASLVLLLYTYSIGRLLAPLFALTLLFFANRIRRTQIAAVLVIVAAAAVPIAIFNHTHDGALTKRFREVTWVTSVDVKPFELLPAFEQHYIDNLLPVGMALRGDPNLRHHVPGSGGSILVMTFLLAAAGAAFGLRTGDRFWGFMVTGALLSVVPVALTTDRFHTLRMAPYPIFLIVLSIPAMEALRRPLVAALLALGLAQAAWFFWIYYQHGAEAERAAWFDAGIRPAVRAAIDTGKRPIYIHVWAWVQVYWYAAQRGVGESAFIRGSSTRSGDVVISDHDALPPGAVVLSDDVRYKTYVVP